MICGECGDNIATLSTDDIDLVDKYFQLVVPPIQLNADRGAVLGKGLSGVEVAIDKLPGDPGKLYPLHERVRRVVGALQARARR